MKHPSHGVVALIFTENPDGDCPEFDVKVEGKVMSCKIHGVPGLKWYIGCSFDKPRPTATTQCIYYTYESYLEGTRMDGPLEIDRRLQSSRTRLSPGRNSGLEMFFFLPVRFDGKHVNGCFEPRNWLIELKIYESDEYFDFPETGKLSSARSVMLGRQGVFPKFNKLRYKGSERLIIHYKWQYHCVNLVLELHPRRRGGKTPKSITERTKVEERPTPMLLDSAVLNPLEERPEPLPEYSWGPRAKDPPAWEQKGRNFTRLGVRAERGRSHLGKRVYNTKGSSTRPRRPVALQKAKIRGERPMLPIAPPSQPMKHLPVGWELRYTNTWKVYYVNHKDRYTTWQNPLVEEPGESEKDQSDRGMEVWPRGGGQPRTTPTRLQQMDGAMELLCKERAHTEAGIQRLRLGYAHPGEWKDTHIEHWFPEDEASEPIIEHIDTYTTDYMTLWHAFWIRDAIIIKMETLERERSELEGSMNSGFLSESTSECGSTSECDEKNRRKKRSSEELEEDDCGEVQTSGEHDGRIDYREDYGPEVPVTRDGKIDPDWHRDKIAKFRRETSSNFLDEHNKDSPSCQEDPVPILIADSPFDHDMEADDYQLQEAIEQSLRQYDIDLDKKQAYKSPTNEPSRKSSTEELSECGLKGYGPPWRKAPQKPSEDNDYNMEANEEPEHSMSRKMSKLLAEDDLMDHDMVCESEPDASTLVDVTEPNNTNLGIRIDIREDPDDSVSTQVFQPSRVEDHDTRNDDELYAPPPWYWLVKFGQMHQSPPRPVLVLRGGLQAANSKNVTATLGQAPNEQRVHDEPMIAPLGFRDVVPAASVISRTSTLAAVVSAQVLKDDLAKLTVDSSDGRPAGESDSTSTSTPTVDSETGSCGVVLAGKSNPTSSGSKSKKNRRKSNRISDSGGGEPSTSIVSSERHYNLRKRNSKS